MHYVGEDTHIVVNFLNLSVCIKQTSAFFLQIVSQLLCFSLKDFHQNCQAAMAGISINGLTH